MDNKILRRDWAHLLKNNFNNIDEESDELIPLESKKF